MKRLYTTLALCAFFIIAVNAQEVTRYYLNNNVPTQSKDSATYYIKFNASENGLLNFERFCMDNQLKEKGTVQSMLTLIREGEITTFYSNGNKKDVTSYSEGLPNGMQTHYFSNGKVNYKILNQSAGYGYSLQKESTSKYLFCANENDEITLQDGNGYFKAYDDYSKISQEGNVKNTVADGIWKGYEANKLVFTEFYKNGILIKGENYAAAEGKIYAYQQRSKRPEPKGGINNFYTHISASLQDMNFNNEKITMKFIVDVTGNIQNIEVVNSSNRKVNDFAVNALKNAPKWNPALEQGKPVERAYYMPISIKY